MPTADGFFMLSDYDQDKEDEADTLAGTILLPRIALVSLIERQIPREQILEQYRVSKELLEMRLRLTGVYRQYSRRI